MEISQHIEVFKDEQSLFVIKSTKDIYEKVPETIKLDSTKLKRGIVPWGEDNNFPNTVTEVIGKNTIASPAIEFKIDVTYGSGVKIGQIIDNKFVEYPLSELKSKKELFEIYEFFESNDILTQYAELISDIQWFYQGFVEIILNKDVPGKRKIVEFSTKEASYSRLEIANPKTGKLERHVYSATWPDKPKEEDMEVSLLLDYKSPSRDLSKRLGRIPDATGKTKIENSFRYIIPIRIPTPGKLYYPKPYYLSAVESGWLDLGNAIPEYKKAYMQNSMSVKYIIEISEEYFPRIFHEEGLTTKEEQEKRKKKEIDNINTFLRGVKAAGKSMITYTKRTPNGDKTIAEVQITVLNNKLGGEFIEDSQEASAMIFNAFRVHPSMIGVIPGKTTSNLSGSDKRELLRISQSLQARYRNAVLKPLYVVKKINNWPEEVEFAIPDIILTTLDENQETKQVISK